MTITTDKFIMQSKPQDYSQARELLKHALTLGISIELDGENLRLTGDTKRLDSASIAALRAQKGEMIALLSACDERLQATTSRPDTLPLSQSQHRHLQQAAPLTLRVATVHGSLDPAILAQAAHAVFQRHEALRTRVTAAPESPRQQIESPAPDTFSSLTLPHRPDLSALPTLIKGDSPVHLLQIRHAGGETLVLAAPRWLADDWSLNRVLREWAIGYSTLNTRDSQAAAPLATPQLADYALAEQRMLNHPANELRRQQALVRLGHDGSTDRPYTCNGHTVSHNDLANAVDLGRLAGEQGVTQFAILLAGYELAAHLTNPGGTPLLSIPFANRQTRAFANTVGPLESTVALRLSQESLVGNEQTLGARILNAQALLSFAHDQQDLPLAASLAGAGALSAHIGLLTTVGPLQFGDVLVEEDAHPVIPADAPLALVHRHDGDKLSFTLAYDAARHEEQQITALVDHYQFILANARALMTCPIDNIPTEPQTRARFLADRSSDPQQITSSLCAIFASVLKVAQVNPDSNFFELAGNSLSVAKVVSRIKREFNVAISFSEVFRNPTPAGLAALIMSRGTAVGPTLTHRPGVAELPAAPQQARYFSSYNVSLAKTARASVVFGEWDDLALFEQALNHLVQRHELLRTGFFEQDGTLMQTIAAATPLQCEVITPEATTPLLIRREIERLVRAKPFELAQPPLLHAVVARMANGKVLSAVSVFSGILDAFSEGLLEDELVDAYDRARNGTLALWDALPLQYQDFSRWQHELAQSAQWDKARQFWHEAYPEDYAGFHFPVTQEGPRKAEMRVFLLGEELSESVKRAAAASESSLFGYLLANFFQLAATFYQRNDVSVGLLYHGRENEELERLIGYFVDLLCLRCDVAPDEPFPTLVKRVNDALFASIDMRSYQYQQLSARFDVAPSDPIFPITGFHVNNVIAPGREKQVPADFTTQVLALPYAPKFDFNIYVHESNRGILLRMAYAQCVADTETAAKIAETFIDLVTKNTSAA